MRRRTVQSDRWVPFAVETRAQTLALDVRHHVPEKPFCRTRIEEREQVRMLKIRRDADLAQESLGAQYSAELGIEHFERDQAVVSNVPREVDRSHSTTSEFAREQVAFG